MNISTIALASRGDFGEGGVILTKRCGRFEKKWLSKPADALKWLAGEAVEALRAIVVSDVGVILSCVVKPVGSAAEHTRAIIVFFAELIGGMVDAKSEKSEIGP